MSIAYAPTVLADAPVAYWRLGEAVGASSAVDASGNGRDGAVTGGVTFGQTGQVNDGTAAALFDGSSGYISPVASAALRPTVFSFELFFVATDVTAVRYLGGCGTTGVFGYLLALQAGQILFRVGNGAVSADARANVSIGTRYHIVATYDGTNMLLYVNASLITTTPLAGPIGYGVVTTFRIAQLDTVLLVRTFSGAIDEVAVYDKVLSLPQIAAHYQAAQPFNAAFARGCNQSIGYVAPPGAMNA